MTLEDIKANLMASEEESFNESSIMQEDSEFSEPDERPRRGRQSKR